MREKILKRLDEVEENCLYTADTHHIIAESRKQLATFTQVIPAILAAGTGVLAANQIWFEQTILLSIVSAAVSAVGAILNPMGEYFEHRYAAKQFTVVKQEARSLRTAFSHSLSDAELEKEAKRIDQRYSDIVTLVPPTDDESFKKAQQRIKSGVHKHDSTSN